MKLIASRQFVMLQTYFQSKIPMSSSQSSQFPPKSIVKNKSYEGVEALRQIASTSLFLDNEQKVNGQTIPTILEPEEGMLNEICLSSPIFIYDAF